LTPAVPGALGLLRQTLGALLSRPNRSATGRFGFARSYNSAEALAAGERLEPENAEAR
jgi:hypothetical protein